VINVVPDEVADRTDANVTAINGQVLAVICRRSHKCRKARSRAITIAVGCIRLSADIASRVGYLLAYPAGVWKLTV
jgi:hypothetical protein